MQHESRSFTIIHSKLTGKLLVQSKDSKQWIVQFVCLEKKLATSSVDENIFSPSLQKAFVRCCKVKMDIQLRAVTAFLVVSISCVDITRSQLDFIEHVPDDCYKPKDVGPCRAMIPAYYYDPASKECREFTYGGCPGNGNNFYTPEECTEFCFKKTEPNELQQKLDLKDSQGTTGNHNSSRHNVIANNTLYE